MKDEMETAYPFPACQFHPPLWVLQSLPAGGAGGFLFPPLGRQNLAEPKVNSNSEIGGRGGTTVSRLIERRVGERSAGRWTDRWPCMRARIGERSSCSTWTSGPRCCS